MKKRSSKKGIIIAAVIILIMAVLAYMGYGAYGARESRIQAERVLLAMAEVVPGFESGGNAESPEAAGRTWDGGIKAITIEGHSIVGCLEVPALDIRVPVTSEDEKEEGFVYYGNRSDSVSGAGGLKICGSRHGVFGNLSELEPGDAAFFIDIDGRRYEYRVVTQYHLKTWDEGGNDMMLCYSTDDKTEFIVGFSAE